MEMSGVRYTEFEKAKAFFYSHTKNKKYDLNKIIFFMKEMDNFYKKIPVIHVVGTNGKGSISSTIASILWNAGYKTGLFTSPHLVNIRERIVVDGHWISEEEFCRIVSEISCFADEMNRKSGEYPTFFELMYSTAMRYFYNTGVDVAVLEAGLGGRLDATNISNPILTIITKIAYDHPKTLGNTLKKIAFEKADVIRKDSHVIVSPQRKDIFELISGIARERNSSLIYSKNKGKSGDITFDGRRFYQSAVFDNFGKVDLALIGNHQVENGATVIDACRVLKKIGYSIDDEAIKIGFKRNRWPGRLEYIRSESLKPEFRNNIRGIYIDGAHNANGMQALKKALKKIGCGKLPVICGVLGDKGPRKLHKSLRNITDQLYITRPDSPRSIPSSELAEKFENCGLHVLYYSDDILKTFLQLKNSLTEPTDILICGSLYLVGEYKKLLCSEISEQTFISL